MRPATIILTVLLFLPAIGYSATYYVPDDYPTIQEAINGSLDGDTIIVRPGTYMENINFIGKAITLKSEQGSVFTILDGNQTGRPVKFDHGEGKDSVIQGFTITNGVTGT